MTSAADRLLNAAAVVDGWPETPRHAQVLEVLSELDLIALRLGRLIVPDEPQQSLHQCARALYTMSAQPAPDVEGATAVVRVATRCIAAAHRALDRIKETP
ncbi:hypothetical protein [Rhodanobacter denitrificans]|uniref:Uncharacterized protein n=1 Tax=Rhodanobacter denitrificans TaxID=666685 RepID=M4NDG1_9GAMM|nr:hypothetical protein [Rhodanobacter denitrificans]AGG88764.1 hypothetical protein R2APBS1_1629 [Rhodanobacter denitrificans]UJJ58569.1 hypothetical protein LRK55_00065 [Rhodanobacter denitrificans]UJM87896.1 hypothetical protein LRJ86_06220 [Rhodanobacter denitrificans]